MEEENKKILSWDVGIKNLAYCLMNKKGDKFKILKWGVINLAQESQKCEFSLRGGKCCEQNAKFFIYHRDKKKLLNEYESGEAFSCQRHKIKMFPVAQEINIEKSTNKTTKKSKVAETKICCECDDYAIMELTSTDYCWCAKHYEKKGLSFIKKINAKKVVVANCNRQPIQGLSEKLFSTLDNDFSDFLEAEEVLIENQPSLRNPTMKTISSFLYSYFMMRGILDKETTKSNIELVKFISPSNKLKVNEGTTNKVLQDEKDKNKKDVKAKVYKLTKKLGIKYCKALINETDNEIIDKVKKKDDMCDAFLQGFQYLFSPLPDKYFEKLKKIGLESK